jgi:membrane protein DedA with SNARE-associated domain
VQTFISNYGYLAIFVLMLAESACIPVPSELIMTFGGALAAGAVPGTHLNLIGVILTGTAGNVAGSYIAWAVGRYGAEPALRRLAQGRWGRRIGIRAHDIDRGTAWFDRHGNKAVLIGRVLPVVRTFISLPAGIAEMPAPRFGIYTTIGCIPWTTALAVAGYAVGKNWESIVNAFHGPTYIIAAVAVAAVVILAWRYVRSRRPEDGSADGGGEPASDRSGRRRRGAHRHAPGTGPGLWNPADPARRPGNHASPNAENSPGPAHQVATPWTRKIEASNAPAAPRRPGNPAEAVEFPSAQCHGVRRRS